MSSPAAHREPIPRIIWSVWFQGWENASDLIRACRASWERLNPGWRLHFLTDDSSVWGLGRVGDFLPQLADRPMTRSDLLRLELLHLRGGVWVDATTYCLRPLDSWLEDVVAPAGFFAFAHPGAHRMLSNWFLAASRDCNVIPPWRRAAYDYWVGRASTDDYYWMHHLFGRLYADEMGPVRRAWDMTPKRPARGPHAFVPYDYQLFRQTTDWHREVVERSPRQMLKLTRHLDHDQGGPGTLYRWLCDRELI
jgi:Capsular polysaccharide synthesis protein